MALARYGGVSVTCSPSIGMTGFMQRLWRSIADLGGRLSAEHHRALGSHDYPRTAKRQELFGSSRWDVPQGSLRRCWMASELFEAEVAMIEIRHTETGALLLQLEADTLAGSQLSEQVLRGADLRGADLRGIQLRRAYLISVDLREANLENARLNGADLTDVLLSGANLRGAHLTEAKVRSADFRQANLTGAAFQNTFVVDTSFDQAMLTGANLHRATFITSSLREASLSEADLTGAFFLAVNFAYTNLSDTAFAETCFADCQTLHEALGLSAVKHLGLSSLDVRTVRACVTYLSDAFLQSVGYTAAEIRSLKTLYAQTSP